MANTEDSSGKKRIGYVLISSDHNLPEYRACMEVQPDEILILTSDRMAKNATDTYLKAQLAAKLVHSRIHILRSTDAFMLTGEDMATDLIWLGEVFKPAYEQLAASCDEVILNMTGGTKLFLMMLIDFAPWTRLHYQAYQHDYIQVLGRDGVVGNEAIMPAVRPLRLQRKLSYTHSISPIEHCTLYNFKVQARRASAVRSMPEALTVATLLHESAVQAYGYEKDGFQHTAWGVLSSYIADKKLWHEPEGDQALIGWEDLLPAGSVISQKQMVVLLEQLNSLGPYISWSEDGISLPLPSRKDKKVKAWIKFIESEWFELLIEHWLKKIAPASVVQSSIEVKGEQGDGGREADILWVNKGNLSVFELKVDFHSSQARKQSLHQLDSLGNRLGLVSRVMVMSPEVLLKMDDNAVQMYSANCKGHGLIGCIALSPETLAYALNKRTNVITPEEIAISRILDETPKT
jgi:hypothetical protein